MMAATDASLQPDMRDRTLELFSTVKSLRSRQGLMGSAGAQGFTPGKAAGSGVRAPPATLEFASRFGKAAR